MLTGVGNLSRAGDALQLVYAGAVSGGTHDRRPVDHVDRRRSPDAVETHFEVVADEGDAFL
ncbi:MAG: hypothetical protein P8Y07_04590, partial [Gemmatimonadales bacterium]